MARHRNLNEIAPTRPKQVGAQALAHAHAFLPFMTLCHSKTYHSRIFQFPTNSRQITMQRSYLVLMAFICNTYISFSLLEDNLI
jgi:hypothetical protein